MSVENKKAFLSQAQTELRTLKEMHSKARNPQSKKRLSQSIQQKQRVIKTLRDEIQGLQGRAMHSASRVIASIKRTGAVKVAPDTAAQQRHQAALSLLAMAQAARQRELEEQKIQATEKVHLELQLAGLLAAAKANLAPRTVKLLEQQAQGFVAGQPVKPVTWMGLVRSWWG